MNHQFRKASLSEIPQIWTILEKAIQRRKEDGSNQWQDGYPNPEVIQKDIEKEAGFVLTTNNEIIGYSAVMINDEPAYAKIIGKWITNEDFVVFHRVAITDDYLGKGLSKVILNYIEDFALSNQIYSLKADTNFDNLAMLHLFEKLGYQYCGEVYFRGSARKAFEKVLDKKDNH
ncbi:GNAT family N-acetyltransferase [Flavobacterium sp. L1I52]|uniref:GNAT family N-acetyltransferase n=1 Tax=Flavobacterium pokkalii TaxID=1940408 RepID=A0ABR7USW2_9FLAO|nr:GNAT family N-acetyltransferase [Flavobacterium pokkalii]MBD0725966.1 GNAT family N-acetyltransferase [Flavobacterium pokkalii]